MKLVTVSQMQKIEKEADASGLTYNQMMENAGQGLAEIILDLFVDDAEPEVIGLVGSGNNGGDTLVALTKLVEEGWRHVLILSNVRRMICSNDLLTRAERSLLAIRLLNNWQNASKLPMCFWMACLAQASNYR